MKTIRSLFFVAQFLLITTTILSPDSRSQAQKMTDKMKTDLTLTDDQTVRVLPINQSFIDTFLTYCFQNVTSGVIPVWKDF